MDIFIPTYKRVDKQHTLQNLPKSIRKKTFLVVNQKDYTKNLSEYHDLRLEYGFRYLVVPVEYTGIARVREYIGLVCCSTKFLMLDDDLKFFHRKPGDHQHLFKNKSIHTKEMLQLISDSLDDFAHVSISARAGNNQVKEGYALNSRAIRALAFRRKEFIACKHGRVDVMEDFDVALQLLRNGYKSCVIYEYAQDQQQTQAPGGCSTYRDHEMQAESANKLAKLHPQFVTVREKHNRTGGEFGDRIEVTIAWDKAYRSSVKNPLLRR